MQATNQVNLATPLLATVQPDNLLGRLVHNPQVTVLNLNGQLQPPLNQVAIQANILHVQHTTATGAQGVRHTLAPGPARVWNAMLANERSALAILNACANGQQAWLITEVLTVNGGVVALGCESILYGPGGFIMIAQDPLGVLFETNTSWFRQNPTATGALQIIGICVCAAIAAPIVVGAALGAVGLGAGGVVAGVIAAGQQDGIGNVAAGSLFAGLQSLGAVGLNAGVAATIGGGAAAGAAAGMEAPADAHVHIVNL